ncbi:MAG: peptidylprolyl isomerase [Roseimicrobium sp.]
MKLRPLFYTVLLGTLAPAAKSADALPADGSSVLGRAGAHEVRLEDVRASLAALSPQDQQTASSDPTTLNQMVRSLLVQRLVVEQAKAKKWEDRPEVAAYLQRVKESALAENYLQAQNAPPETYPSEADLQAAYDASKASLLVPRSYRLAQIYLSSPKGASDWPTGAAVREKLADVRKALQQPKADFAALAAAHSDERNSASRGGEIGWLTEGQIQPEIRAQLPKLSLNAVSEPLQLDDGWHILKVLDVREPHTPTLDQVRPQLIRQLRSERSRANTQAYLTELLRENPVAVNELALSQLAPATKK